MNQLFDIQYRLKQPLGESGGVEFVLDELSMLLRPDRNVLNDLVQLRSRYHSARKEFYQKGTIRYRDEFETVSSSIIQGLLMLIDDLRKNDLRPPSCRRRPLRRPPHPNTRASLSRLFWAKRLRF